MPAKKGGLPEPPDDYQPEWFMHHQRREHEQGWPHNHPLMYQALAAMREGDLRPLATLLKDERDGLSPVIRRELVFLIEGNAAQSGGLRLAVQKHPDVSHRSKGRHARSQSHNRNVAIAAYVAASGGFRPGEHEAAITEAMKFYGLSRSRIEEAWSACQLDVRQMFGHESSAT